jgi:hypothetical protein
MISETLIALFAASPWILIGVGLYLLLLLRG